MNVTQRKPPVPNKPQLPTKPKNPEYVKYVSRLGKLIVKKLTFSLIVALF